MADKDSDKQQNGRSDNERRREHLALQALETRVSSLEEQIAGINRGIKSLHSELKRLTTMLSGSEQFDSMMASFRLEVGKSVEKKEKQINKYLDDRLLLITKDIETLNTSRSDANLTANTVKQLKKDVKDLRDEDDRLAARLNEGNTLLEEIRKQYLENQETMASLEATRRREIKAIPELTTEVATLRKRSDDQRAKLDLLQETLRKTSTSLDEFIARDEERTSSYRSLIDEMKLTQHEHDKTWREWLNRFDLVNKTAVELENKLNMLDDSQRKAKQSQKGLDDATLRIERRINEIAEMQRLAEERAHQDWESYVGDEQKRWKTYTVANEEALSESKRQVESIKTRLATLEDATRSMTDTVLMLSEETQKKLQGFLELYHEWAATNADIISRSRPRQ